MRPPLFAVASTLLLVCAISAEAKWRNPFAAPLPSARKRGFTGQEIGDCASTDFRQQYRTARRACDSPNVTGAFDNFTSLDEANAAWGSLCESDCFGMIIDLRTGEYGNCLPADVVEFVVEIAVLCRSDTNGARCGAVLSEASQVACHVDTDDKTPKATCNAIGQCAYSDGVCYAKPSQSYLERVCGGGCISMAVASLASTSSPLATEALTLQQRICAAEADGQYCLAVLQDEMHDLTTSEFQEGIPSASVKAICENDAKRRCFKRVFGGRLESQRRAAEEQFFTCIASMYDDYVRNPKRFNVTEAYEDCQRWFFLVYSATAYVTAAELDQMCTKNGKGEYCVGLMGDYTAGDIVTDSACLSYVDDCFFNCKCSAKCVTQLEGAVDKLGCCLGTLQSIYGTVPDLSYVDPNDIPTLEFNPDDYAGGSGESGSSESSSASSSSDSSSSSSSDSSSSNSSSESGTGVRGSRLGARVGGRGVNASSGSSSSSDSSSDSGSSSSSDDVVEKLSFGLFRNYMVCKSSPKLAGLGSQLRSLCPTPIASTVTRDMPIGLDYAELSADRALQARLVAKLNNDIAVLFGLNAADIRTSLSDGAASAGRRMTEMAAPSTNVRMSMRSQNAADAAAAGSQFDAAQRNKTLVLPSTTRMVEKECKNCAPGGAASLQSAADTSAIPQPPTAAPVSSFSATTHAAAAGVACALLVAALFV